MDRKGFTHLVVLTVIAVIAISMIGVMAYYRLLANDEAATNTNTTVTNTTTNTTANTNTAVANSNTSANTNTATDSTAGWQTYMDSANGFSLMYPPDWESKSPAYTGTSATNGFSEHVFGTAPSFAGDWTILVTVNSKSIDATLNDSTYYWRKLWSIENRKITSINGYVAEEVSYSNGAKLIYVQDPAGHYNVQFDGLYSQTGDLYRNQILSTFQFTDSTAGWQTYTNTTYNYSIKFPANQYTTPEVNGTYTRIQNYDPNPDRMGLINDEYYLEINADGSDCTGQVDNPESATFGSRTGVRGGRPVGGDAGGDGVSFCVNVGSKSIYGHVTGANSDLVLQNNILNTLTFSQ